MTDPQIDPPLRVLLAEVMEESKRQGFIGPGPVGVHLRNAMSFARALEPSGPVVDLGSGGGLPGLVLAVALPARSFTLIDASSRRCTFLSSAVRQLGLSPERVSVRCGRAEHLARDTELRGQFRTVVARSFGPPAVTAECAAGFLAGPGSRILVSEPPDAADARWPAEGLALLGLRRGDLIRDGGATLQVLEFSSQVTDRVPRRDGVPAKRPLF